MLDMVLRILGLIVLWGAIGALIGLIITPFVLYLAYLVAYAIASMIAVLILRKQSRRLIRFQQFANPLNNIIHHSHCKEQTISYAKPIPHFRDYSDGMINRDVVCHTQMPTKPDTTPYETPNQNTSDIVNQPAFKKAPTIIHRLMLFYRDYYCQSIKSRTCWLKHIGNTKLRILAIQLARDRACLEVLKLSLPS